MKILYVEDDARDADITLRMMRKTAPHLQFESVSSINAARERLDHLSAAPLDLVLTDMRLRDGDGLSLLKHIRENDLPLAVIVITGSGDEETAVAALKARADDYVVKSKDYLKELPVTLESALNHYRAGAARRVPLQVLYAESDLADVESTRVHFATNAPHLRLNVVFSGRDVLAALGKNSGGPRYDVLLMTVDLPDISAIEVLREIDGTLKQDLPVVLLCRVEDVEIARQGQKLGAANYVLKNPGYLYELPLQIEDAHAHAELKRRESELQRSEDRNRALLSAIPDLMFVLTSEGTYLDYHAKTDELLFMPPEEFLGKKVSDVMPPDVATQFYNVFAHASDKPSLLEYKLPRPDGDHYYEASVVTCEGDKLLAIVRDITERKLAEESLKSALAEVQQLKDRLHEENIYLQEEIRVASDFGEIIGQSEALRKALRQAEKVAPLDTTVLVLGETGTGKELLAHAIHRHSSRKKHPLVKVNCAALPGPLIESELFGHEKGAYTGAETRRLGRFALADGGTLFLDEVGELPLDLQTKLLRVLEEGEFEMLGSSHTMKVDVRLIAATNRNLSEAVTRGTFRSDLYYRLSIFPIVMPPLRERPEDIRVLAAHFVKQLSAKLGKQIESIPQNAINVLQNYDWPGNVRELRNVIERAVIVTQGSKLQLTDTFDRSTLTDESLTADQDQDIEDETLEQSEYRLILRILKKVHWRVEGPGGAAELLDVHASTLRSRMRKLGINRPKVQAADENG
ncbi:MAG TPA: sigma 54-interacting transcriptional regulator [Pyrinomonadaceae bacterium]|nr:sigma 54-interacting transcriptional regulator [Pyrinomonadaceae bacterium]